MSFALISDPAMYTSGFTLTGNILYLDYFQGVSEERPGIQFFGMYNSGLSAPPDLSITKSHTGSFTQGQSGAAYTLMVRNSGVVATTGTVTVVDNVPAGLTPVSAAGPGWNCNVSGSTTTCTRNDSLSP